MNWVTIDDASNCKDADEALECTRLHWTQILTATKKEILDYRSIYPFHLTASSLCALCCYHRARCVVCAINIADHCCYYQHSTYQVARVALSRLNNGEIDVAEFRSLCQPMLDVIEELCE